MGLKCRLLGHEYGAPEIERNREEQGDEVVVTVRELQVCERCGAEQTVSQNKEVTAIRSPAEVGLEEGAPSEAAPSAAAETAGETAAASNTSPATDAASTSDGSAVDATADSESAVTASWSPEDGVVESGSSEPAASTREQNVADTETSAAEADAGVDSEGSADQSAEGFDRAIDWVDEAEVESTDENASDPGTEAPSGEPTATGAETGKAGAPEDTTDRTSSVEAASDPDADPGNDDGWETGSGEWDDEPEPEVDDAVILSADETERDETQWPEETDTDSVRAAGQSPESNGSGDEGGGIDDEADPKVTNDAEIIDGDDVDDSGAEDTIEETDASDGKRIGYDRDRSAWPDREGVQNESGREGGPSNAQGTAEAGNWPAHEGTDEGFGAKPGEDVDLEFGGNSLTPEVNGHAAAENGHAESVDGVAAGETDDDIHQAADDGLRREGGGFVRTNGSGALESDVPDDRVEFYCPNCGHTEIAGATSIRAGDICPECKQGYIAARER
jgi:predicted RNA-binding Zn-ribbon protein involved in translation (DUF1610 family)